jgi:HK97 family phage prohead protease
MSTKLNTAGVANAHSLVAAGKINTGTWDFTAEDGNKLLGAAGDDWANYGKSFLATHPDQPPMTKAHYGYPVIKNGEVYRNAVVSAKGRAAGQGASEVEAACSSLLDMMDKKSARPQAKDAGVIRAYSTFEIKSIDEDQRIFEGIATTPSTDRMDDVVVPEGAQFKLPIPMLWQHARGSISDPVGQIVSAKVSSSGITVRGQMAKPQADYPQPLRDDLNKAWVLVRDKLVRGLSIGFNAIESSDIEGSWGRKFTKWDFLECSCVTIPANQDANIQTVKSIAHAEEMARRGRVVKIAPTMFEPKPGVFRLPKV